MIDPFVDHQAGKPHGHISYGLSSYGYDIRLGTKFKMLDKANITYSIGDAASAVLDPKHVDPTWYEDYVMAPHQPFIIPGNTCVLGVSYEYIRVPRDILVICIGKSTYARVGLICNTTPLEPMWEGYITLELSNTNEWPVAVYPEEGIAQLVFHRAETECAISYADRKGKYQAQQDIVLARG